MATRVIVDTSVLVALMDAKDVWHGEATAIASGLVGSAAELIYFDCVMNETVSVLARRLAAAQGEAAFGMALRALRNSVRNENVTWVYPTVRRHYDGCMALVANHGGAVNFHDALIAVAAREERLRHIASFDADFDRFQWMARVKSPADAQALR